MSPVSSVNHVPGSYNPNWAPACAGTTSRTHVDASVRERKAQPPRDWRRMRHPGEGRDPSCDRVAHATQIGPRPAPGRPVVPMVTHPSESKTRSVAAIGDGCVIPAKAGIQVATVLRMRPKLGLGLR